jgi:hypothetical protein
MASSAKHRLSDEEVLGQIPRARVRARQAREAEPHAASARYDRRQRVVHVTLTNGSAFSVPARIIPELADASDGELAGVEVGPAGVGLHWPALDADLSVAGLAAAALGRRVLLRAAGAAGGSARSSAKADAARRNGAKGGRPRKSAAKGRGGAR